MNKQNIPKWLLLLGGLSLAVFYILMNFSATRSQISPTSADLVHLMTPISTSTRPSNCVPLPVIGTQVFYTPSPRPTDYVLPTYHPVFSPTPDTTTTRHDFAPALSDNEKVRVYIFRCEGIMELFLYQYGDQSTIYTLNPGDVVIRIEYPIGIIGQKPPSPSLTPSQVITQISPTSQPSSIPPYPFPSSSTPPISYPAPSTSTPQP